jgi:hypothetical protein
MSKCSCVWPRLNGRFIAAGRPLNFLGQGFGACLSTFD